MNKKDIKVGQKYIVTRTDSWLKIGSVVECLEFSAHTTNALYKVRISDLRNERKELGSNFKTASGNISKTFRKFYLETKTLEPYDEITEVAEPKFKEGDLCRFVGTSGGFIARNTIVKYVKDYGSEGTVVESIESKPGFPRGLRFCVKTEDLKPLTPARGMKVGDKLSVFAGRPNAGKSAFPFANLVMPDIAEAEPQYDVEMKVMKIRIRNAQTNPLQHEETPMKFETKYFLNGTDITNFTDMQLFAVIKEAEDAIAKLEDIKTQPKSLKQNIADRKAELAKLVEFLDQR